MLANIFFAAQIATGFSTPTILEQFNFHE